MLRHGFPCVNGKRKEVVTEGQKLAFRSTHILSKSSEKWRIDGKDKDAQLLFLQASFSEKACFPEVLPPKASRFQTRFGPQGAVKNELSPFLRDTVEATNPGNRMPEVATAAAGDSHFCPQPRRGWQRTTGIRYSIEYFRRRRPSRRPPLLAALGAGFARNTQRTPGLRQLLSQGFAHLASPRGASNPRGWLPSSRPQILPSADHWQVRKVRRETES